VPVIQINERNRFIGFRDPGLALIKDHAGLYVGREPDNTSSIWASTTAIREPLERVERSWRGVVMDTYALEKLTGWTPELLPPSHSPLYRARSLAGELPQSRINFADLRHSYYCFNFMRYDGVNQGPCNPNWRTSYAETRFGDRGSRGGLRVALGAGTGPGE
jgi:hypothetical protein